jgi:hypothetical protein
MELLSLEIVVHRLASAGVFFSSRSLSLGELHQSR